MRDRSPYDVLGVPRSASAEQVREAWRRAAFEHHPDRGGDPVRFREALAAFELLDDPARRAAVDAGRLRLSDMLAALAELGPELLDALTLVRSAGAGLWRGCFKQAALDFIAAAAAGARIRQRLAHLVPQE